MLFIILLLLSLFLHLLLASDTLPLPSPPKRQEIIAQSISNICNGVMEGKIHFKDVQEFRDHLMKIFDGETNIAIKNLAIETINEMEKVSTKIIDENDLARLATVAREMTRVSIRQVMRILNTKPFRFTVFFLSLIDWKLGVIPYPPVKLIEHSRKCLAVTSTSKEDGEIGTTISTNEEMDYELLAIKSIVTLKRLGSRKNLKSRTKKLISLLIRNLQFWLVKMVSDRAYSSQ